MLDSGYVLRGGLGKDHDAAFDAVETGPEGKGDGAGDCLPGGEILDTAELLHPTNDEVIGEDSAFVLSSHAVGDESVLVERHHDVGAAAVHPIPQLPV